MTGPRRHGSLTTRLFTVLAPCVVAVASLSAGCSGSKCPPTACTPSDKGGGITVSGLAGPTGSSAAGSAKLEVPDWGTWKVNIKCSSITITADTPKAGQTNVVLKCTFDKAWSVTGDVEITLVSDSKGNGEIKYSGGGKISIPFKDDMPFPCEGQMALNGGKQEGGGQQAAVAQIAVQQGNTKGTATISRLGNTLTVTVDKPVLELNLTLTPP